jgi:hypothetical protein
MNVPIILALCAVVVAYSVACICRRRHRRRIQAISRIVWLINNLNQRGGNEFAIEHEHEIDALIDRFDLMPSEVKLGSWDELCELTRKSYRAFCLRSYQKHAQLRRRLLKTTADSSQFFDEVFLAELIPLAQAYCKSLLMIVRIRSRYKILRDAHLAELSTFAHLDRIAC